MEFTVKIYVDNEENRCFKKDSKYILKELKKDLKTFNDICRLYKGTFTSEKVKPFIKNINWFIIARSYIKVVKIWRNTITKKKLFDLALSNHINIAEVKK